MENNNIGSTSYVGSAKQALQYTVSPLVYVMLGTHKVIETGCQLPSLLKPSLLWKGALLTAAGLSWAPKSLIDLSVQAVASPKLGLVAQGIAMFAGKTVAVVAAYPLLQGLVGVIVLGGIAISIEKRLRQGESTLEQAAAAAADIKIEVAEENRAKEPANSLATFGKFLLLAGGATMVGLGKHQKLLGCLGALGGGASVQSLFNLTQLANGGDESAIQAALVQMGFDGSIPLKDMIAFLQSPMIRALCLIILYKAADIGAILARLTDISIEDVKAKGKQLLTAAGLEPALEMFELALQNMCDIKNGLANLYQNPVICAEEAAAFIGASLAQARREWDYAQHGSEENTVMLAVNVAEATVEATAQVAEVVVHEVKEAVETFDLQMALTVDKNAMLPPMRAEMTRHTMPVFRDDSAVAVNELNAIVDKPAPELDRVADMQLSTLQKIFKQQQQEKEAQSSLSAAVSQLTMNNEYNDPSLLQDIAEQVQQTSTAVGLVSAIEEASITLQVENDPSGEID